MEKIKCETVDFAAENAAKLIKLFPECEGERGMVDLDKLRQVLSSSVVNGDVERYQFTWPGKRKAMAAANAATTKTLRPAILESVGRDGTAGKFDSENLYIEGDNLEALKLLQCNYAGKVKMIYIDPPYNTGHDFVYRDRFSLTDKELAQEGGAFDEDGNRFEKNDSAEARYHSNWCSMMYPRLKLARNLLRDDGVLFMSIDDNEVVNARKLCDEVFGESNFVAQLSIIVKTEGRQYGCFAKTHEYLLAYAKSIFYVTTNEVRDPNGSFQYSDEKGGFNVIGLRNRAVRIFNSSNRPNLRYPIYVDVDNPTKEGLCSVSTISKKGWVEVWPSIVDGLESVWRWGKDTAEKNKEELLAIRGVDGEFRIFKKDRSLTVMAKTVWFDKEINSIYGTREVASLIGKGYFDFPKPISLLKKAIEVGSDKNSIVLDFFSGSATTAHAVMQLNAEDGGDRKFILVQLPEVCAEDSEAAKAGYKNICEIGKERIRRAGKKIVDELAAKNAKVAKAQREEADLFSESSLRSPHLCDSALKTNPTVDIGFRVLKIDSSSLNDVSATVGETNQMMFDKLERIKSDRTPEDILFQLLIETHIPLSDPIAKVKVGGNEVFFVGVEEDGFRQDLQDSSGGNNPVNPVQKIYESAPLVACLDRTAKLTNEFFLELAAFKPGIAFFRDDAFNDDAARINVEQIFKQNSPNTIVKVI